MKLIENNCKNIGLYVAVVKPGSI